MNEICKKALKVQATIQGTAGYSVMLEASRDLVAYVDEANRRWLNEKIEDAYQRCADDLQDLGDLLKMQKATEGSNADRPFQGIRNI